MPMDDWRDSDRRRDPYGRPDPRSDSDRLRGRTPDDRAPERHAQEDYGQADYSERYAYDPRTRTGYRSEGQRGAPDAYGRPDPDRERYDSSNPFRRDEPRSFGGRDALRDDSADREREMRRRDAEAAFAADREARGPRDTARDAARDERDSRGHRHSRRDGPSDRVLWAVIMERLDSERRLDLREVDIDVRGAEVTLNGFVRRKEDKRRIEDVADVDGVRHIQNNLRVRDRERGWTFL